jgi:uncharacterized protein
MVAALPPRRRSPDIPELFLGLLTIAVAGVVMTHILSDTVRDSRRSRDTITVTGSAKKPISANLVRWTISVSAEAPTAAPAARRLRRDSVTVRKFLTRGGVPPDAISSSVVSSQKVVERLPHNQQRAHYVVTQRLEVSTREIDAVEPVSTRIGQLIERGVGASAQPLEYYSTELTQAKLDVLGAATEDARNRAEILVHGLGGKLGRMRASSLGVFQVVPRDSTEVSDYGINDTASREKDATAVVSATFAVKH